jgi:hypothetical protein
VTVFVCAPDRVGWDEAGCCFVLGSVWSVSQSHMRSPVAIPVLRKWCTLCTIHALPPTACWRCNVAVMSGNAVLPLITRRQQQLTPVFFAASSAPVLPTHDKSPGSSRVRPAVGERRPDLATIPSPPFLKHFFTTVPHAPERGALILLAPHPAMPCVRGAPLRPASSTPAVSAQRASKQWLFRPRRFRRLCHCRAQQRAAMWAQHHLAM